MQGKNFKGNSSLESYENTWLSSFNQKLNPLLECVHPKIQQRQLTVRTLS